MLLFLVLWSTALGIVYYKIKRSGMIAPKKRIFILHIVLVLLFLALKLSAFLVMKKAVYWGTQGNYGYGRMLNCLAADAIIM